MGIGAGSYGLAFVAGLLSILSPCVLPLVPIVVGTALTTHRYGPLALAGGLALSFTLIGLFVATIGFAIGLDTEWFRTLAALLLVALGVVLLSAPLQRRFAALTAGLGSQGDAWLQRMRIDGIGGQWVVGLLLGLVWAPCVGPTLGAAATLASQGRDLWQVALVMALFGIGAALPLLIAGSVSRQLMARSRGGLLLTGVVGKTILGVLMVALGIAMLSGVDRTLEAWLVEHSPAWLTALTTRF